MEKERFNLKEEHLKLLRRAYVDWNDCETGAPCIDPKRPYGNSYVAGDVHAILHPHAKTKDYGNLTNEKEEEYLKTHSETQTALQIILSTGRFEPATYEADKYSNNWKRVK